MDITFDIETRPCDDPVLIEDIAQQANAEAVEAMESIKAPANYKDETKIAEYIITKQNEIKANASDVIAQKIAKTSLDGAYGQICCIGWMIDDKSVQHVIGADEKAVLAQFYDSIAGAAGIKTHDRGVDRACNFIGHNMTGFDLRFIWQRSVIHGLRRPAVIPFNVKPWDERLKDTMLMWNPDRDKKISLDKLCKVLGVKSSKSGDIDGSKIAQAWADGRHQEIADYCMADVVATRECYRRMAA